jgi:hypothetical protein
LSFDRFDEVDDGSVVPTFLSVMNPNGGGVLRRPRLLQNQLLFIDVDTRMYAFTNAHQRSRFVSSSISGRRFLIARWALENWQAQLIKGHASV